MIHLEVNDCRNEIKCSNEIKCKNENECRASSMNMNIVLVEIPALMNMHNWMHNRKGANKKNMHDWTLRATKRKWMINA